MKSEYIIALYAVAAVVLLLVIRLMCYLTLKQPGFTATGQGADLKAPAAELFRLLILYSQYMMIISGMDVEWPNSISYPLRVLAWVWSPTSPETFSIACILPRTSTLPLALQQVLFYICMPVALLLILVLIEVSSSSLKRFQKLSDVVSLHDRVLSNSLVAVFFFMPSVVRTLLSMFACIPIDQPAITPYKPAAVGSFWILDTNQECFAGYHKAWSLGLGLPLTLVVCLALPCSVLLVISRNAAKLQDEDFMKQYGFLYKSYKQHYCCWEVVVLLQTMLVVAISVFGVNIGAFYQCIVMTGALMLMVFLLLACQPYEHPQAARVSLHSLCCLLLTSYLALTFLQYGSVKPSAVYGLVMGTCLLLVNVAFVASVLWQLSKMMDWHQVATLTVNGARKFALWCVRVVSCDSRLHEIKPWQTPSTSGHQQQQTTSSK